MVTRHTGLAQNRESLPTKNRSSTSGPRNQLRCSLIIIMVAYALRLFPCFYRRTEQGSHKQETSHRRQCGIACLNLCLLKVSPFNARLTLPSYVHPYIFPFFGDVHHCYSNTSNKVFYRFFFINRPPPA